jgi:hypothetical protein
MAATFDVKVVFALASGEVEDFDSSLSNKRNVVGQSNYF